LDSENYYIWHRKVQYPLNEEEIMETLTQSMEAPPKKGNSPQYQRDVEAYAK